MLTKTSSAPLTLHPRHGEAIAVSFSASAEIQSTHEGHFRDCVGIALISVASDADTTYPCAFRFPAALLDTHDLEALVATAVRLGFYKSGDLAALLLARAEILRDWAVASAAPCVLASASPYDAFLNIM